jgi:galactokinase
VVRENGRVRRAAEALGRGDLVALGQLMNQSHASLREDMQVSTVEVDRLAAIAQQAPGVLGARMMGGGFGGCVIALVDAARAGTASEAIQGAYAAVIGKAPDAFVCRAVAGAGEIVA